MLVNLVSAVNYPDSVASDLVSPIELVQSNELGIVNTPVQVNTDSGDRIRSWSKKSICN
jgi:hypothetical protein